MRVPTKDGERRQLLVLVLVGIGIFGGTVFFGKELFDHVQEELHSALEQDYEALASRSLAQPDRSRATSNFLRAYTSSVPRLFIDIKFKRYEELRKKRDDALRAGRFLFRGEDDLVPASIRHDGRNVRVRLRLKGDFTDHLETDKWSFRVEVRGEDHLFGMRRFSLQSPHTKHYHQEALFLDHVRREGLLAVDYFFVDVTVNGRHLGLMAVEEHFSKELLEAQNRREGVIVRYDETDFWYGFRRRDILSRGRASLLPNIFDNWKVAWVKPFRKTRVQRSELLSRHAALAASMLRGLANEKLAPSDVFDVQQLGKFVAICDLWGVEHPIRWHNMRFYLDPMTLRLEPIGFDGNVSSHAWHPRPFLHRSQAIWFWQDLVTDPRLRNAYLEHYQRMLEPAYIDRLETFLEEREQEYLAVLYREFPTLPRFDFETIRIKVDSLGHGVHPKHFVPRRFDGGRAFEDKPLPRHPRAVYAYFIRGTDGAVLELLNPLSTTVIVDELVANDGQTSRSLGEVAGIPLPITLPPNFHDVGRNRARPLPVSRKWSLPEGEDWSGLLIAGAAHLEGQDVTYRFRAQPYQAPLEEPLFVEHADLERVLARYPFLRWDDGRFLVEQGSWEIDEPLEIPETITVEGADGEIDEWTHPGLSLPAGTTLDFAGDAYLRLSGPLDLEGSKRRPVVLEGRGGAAWKGILVKHSPRRSRWSHAVVRDTTFTERGPWKLTGGVTFYQSDVTIAHTRFLGSTAEDALNLVRSDFVLEDLAIEGSSSDAVDADFCTGLVRDSSFSEIGGDGLDVSGSTVEVTHSRFRGVRDKALSVGEASTLDASYLTIEDSGVAIASKDASTATISNSTMNPIEHVALMAYTKKPEYGGASLTATNNVFDPQATLYRAQRRHRILIDGKKVYSEDFDVAELYESGHMAK